MARLFADEGFPRLVTVAVRKYGHDVLTVQEAGLAGRGTPDAAILTYALAQKRAVLTWNRRDFIRLHRQFTSHSGIVVCTEDANFSAQAGRIHQAVESLPSLDNQLIRVNRPV